MTLTTLYTGATLRHCFEHIRRHQRESLNAMFHKMKNITSLKDVEQYQEQFMNVKLLNFN